MSRCQDLPNVYPALPPLQFTGEGFVVRNTFIDVQVSGSEQPAIRRTRSTPELRSVVHAEPSQPELRERTVSRGEALCEVRCRVLNGAAQGEVGCSMTRARTTSDIYPDCYVRAVPNGSFTESGAGFHCPCGEADHGVSMGCGDADLRSNASTRAPSPSNRSQRSMVSKFSLENNSLMGSNFETGSLLGSRLHDSVEEEAAETTFMIRSLPHWFTRTQLEQLLDSEGFQAKYDFLYLPTDLKAGETFGYGFINLINPREGERFQDHFHGYNPWQDADQEPMGVHASEGFQGLDELIKRYRNSPLMHKTVHSSMRPAIYKDGQLAAFPPPTVRLRPLRVRASLHRKLPGQEKEARLPKA